MNEKTELLVEACKKAGVDVIVVQLTGLPSGDHLKVGRGEDIYIGSMSPQQASDVVTFIQEAGDNNGDK